MRIVRNSGHFVAAEGYALAARGHYALLYGPEDRRDAVHLGASARYRNLDNDTFDNQARYRQRPFFHFNRDAQRGYRRARRLRRRCVGRRRVRLDERPVHAPERDREHGAPAQGWRGRREQSLGRLPRRQVERPLHEGGPGAWELAARADYIDLNNQGVKGGEQISYIGGVNWYLNDYVRFMLDGAITQVFNAGDSAAAVDGSSNLIYGAGMRAQVDW